MRNWTLAIPLVVVCCGKAGGTDWPTQPLVSQTVKGPPTYTIDVPQGIPMARPGTWEGDGDAWDRAPKVGVSVFLDEEIAPHKARNDWKVATCSSRVGR